MIAKFCSAKAQPRVMANYLLNDRVADHTAQCLYGDKDIWLNKMKGFKANHPYLSFVYAFSDNDSKKLTPEIEQNVIQQFLDVYSPSIALAFLNILAVKHTDKNNDEIHILLSNMRYDSNKMVRFSPSHKGEYLKKLQLLQKKINNQYGFENPNDIKQTNTIIDTFKMLKTNKEKLSCLTTLIEEKVADNQIGSKDEIIKYLNQLGFNVNRIGKNYISIKSAEMRKNIRLKGLFYGQDSIKEMIRYRHNLKSSKLESNFSLNDEKELVRIVDKHAQKLKQSFLKYQNSTKALNKQNDIQRQKNTDVKNIKINSRKKNNGKFSNAINQISRAIKNIARFAKDHFKQSDANKQTKLTDRRITKAKSETSKLLARFFNSQPASYTTTTGVIIETNKINKNESHTKINKN
ncbi:MAG: relaxase/mobilization nuclease domain-containing protein [Colwellia polaris]